jgi:hypothetical protein
MLIVEQTNNGRTVVKLRKDWSPSRIGKAYTPPKPPADKDAYRVQTAFIGKGIK